MAAGDLDAALRIFRTPEAARYAGPLFRESFGADFPRPRDGVFPSISTPPEAWRQFVAVYRWPDGGEETVGFLNWIRHRDVYLGGGMCVQKTFYRRLPREQFAEINRRGGIAQMLLEASFRDIDDCAAWFGYCGDKKALAVDLRAGFQTTHQPYVVVKWREALPRERQRELVDAVAAIGPF
jgi:hypothetical protein